jgi:hypothetical protein
MTPKACKNMITPIPQFMNVIHLMKTIHKRKIRKSKIKFPLISMQKIPSGYQLQKNNP